MFDVPINSTATCKEYFSNPQLSIPKFLIAYAISQCLENLEEGRGGGFGVDLFITAVAKEYFERASQVIIIIYYQTISPKSNWLRFWLFMLKYIFFMVYIDHEPPRTTICLSNIRQIDSFRPFKMAL